MTYIVASTALQGSDEKQCEWCGRTFARPPRYGNKQWEERRFCGRSCRSKWVKQPSEAVGYGGAHQRVKKLHGPPSAHRCVDCGECATEYAFNNSDGPDVRVGERGLRYSVNPEDYDPVCRSCHRQRDRPTHCKYGHELTPDKCMQRRSAQSYIKRKRG